jgi:hypothetical protein
MIIKGLYIGHLGVPVAPYLGNCAFQILEFEE